MNLPEYYLVFDDVQCNKYGKIDTEEILSVHSQSPVRGSRWRYRSIFTYPGGDLYDHNEWQDEQYNSGQPKLKGFRTNNSYDAVVCPIDIDCDYRMIAKRQMEIWHDYFQAHEIPHLIYLSGKKGYHIELHKDHVGWERSTDLADEMGNFVKELRRRVEEWRGMSKIRLDVDMSLYQRQRKYRLPNCSRSNGNYKVICPSKILHKDPARQYSWASEPRPLPSYRTKRGKIDLLEEIWEEGQEKKPPVTVKKSGTGRGTVSNITQGSLEDISDELERRNPSAQWDQYQFNQGTKKYDRLGDVKCPVHNDRNPSAYWVPGASLFQCRSCGAGIKELANTLGINLEWKSSQNKSTHNQKLKEARDNLEEKMRGAIEGNQSTLIKVPTGVGKSHTARKLAYEYNQKYQGKALFLTHSHEKAEEEKEKGVEDFDMPGLHPDKPWVDEPQCGNPDVAHLEDESVIVQETCDSRKSYMKFLEDQDLPKLQACENCPFREECTFQEKFKEMGGEDAFDYSVFHYLSHDSTMNNWSEDVPFVVVDEDCFDSFLGWKRFSIPNLIRAVENHPEIQVYGEGVPDYINLQKITEYIVENERLPSDTDPPYGLDDVPMGEIYMDIDGDRDYIGFNDDIEYNIETEEYQILNRWRSVLSSTIQKIEKKRGYLYVSLYNEPGIFEELEDTPFLFLDASAHEADLRFMNLFLEEDITMEEIEIENKNTIIRHDPSSTWSDNAKKKYIKRYEGQEDGFNRLQGLIRYINSVEGRKGLITHKRSSEWKDKFVEILFKETDLGEDDYMWFGNLRGFDGMKGVDHLFIVGDPSPNPNAYYQEGLKFGVDFDPESIVMDKGYDTDHYTINYEMVRPSKTDMNLSDEIRWPIGQEYHPQGQFLYDRLIRKELYQAIGRARGMIDDCEIYIFSSPDFDHSDHSYQVQPNLLSNYSGSLVSLPPSKDEREGMILLDSTWMKMKDIADVTNLSSREVRSLKDKYFPDRKQNRDQEIRDLYETGDYTQEELGEKFDVFKSTISDILNS